MKIVELTAENFKKLKAVQITPSGNVVQITGANDQGKSSVLDSIWAAIDAAGYLKETKTKEPIRQGEKKAIIKLDLGELIITRKFLASGATVEVSTKDGACYKSPQQILDALIGKISFDPLAFSMMDEKKQNEMLLSIVPIGIDLADNAAKRSTAFDARTAVNRNSKQLEGQIAGIADVPEDTPDEERPAAAVLAEMQEAQKVNEANEKDRQNLADLRGKATGYQEHIDYRLRTITSLEEEMNKIREKIGAENDMIKDFEKKKTDIVEEGKALRIKVDALKDIDLTEFDTKLADLEETNKNVRRKVQKKTLQDALAKEVKESEAFTKTINDLDTAKNDAIKKAAFPVEGLGFEDNGVTYNGVPFSQSGSAVRLRVSIGMAMAMNPKLRVIRISDGSLLDSKNMAIIEEMAKEHDFQCFVEKVDETGKIGIVIEDGSVKGAEVASE